MICRVVLPACPLAGLLMEQRRYERIKIGYKTTLVSGSAALEGVIDDLSENGVSVVVYSSEPLQQFTPDTEVTLNFQPTSEETLTLQCRVKWVDRLQRRGRAYRIGMEVIDPPWKESKSFL